MIEDKARRQAPDLAQYVEGLEARIRTLEAQVATLMEDLFSSSGTKKAVKSEPNHSANGRSDGPVPSVAEGKAAGGTKVPPSK